MSYLDDCVELVTKGTTPTSIGGNFTDSGINFLKVESISESGNFIKDKIQFIDQDTHQNLLRRSQLQENDILFSIAGTIGRTAIATPEILPCNTNQALAIIRPNLSKVNPYFLLYCLKDKKRLNKAKSNVVQSVQSNLSLSEIKKIEIPKYSLQYQSKISEVLKKFDDKIELNQKMNETLEEIAKTLFKSWVIDFDPVRAKAEGRPTGLSKEISDLFPDSFEDTELGEIPKGWEVKALDEIAEFLNGLALQKYPEDEECPRYPVLKIAQLREGSTKNQNVFSSNIPDKYIVRNGDYIFSWSGSLLAKFWLGGDAALNQHLFKVTSQNYPKWFFAGWVEKHLDMFSSIASSKATTMGHIKRSDLKNAKTVVPPIELISSFGEYFSPLREKANLCFLENNILSELRDTLLPRLISGELKISDAENLIEEAGI